MPFESDNFDAGSPAGTHVLEGMLRTLPDSKIVEDLHGHVRIQRNSQKNKRQTVHQIQELVTQSKVLSERNIRHPAAVDRNCFVQMFKRTPGRKRKRRYFASVHQLPERWSTIMGRKNWGSLSEEVLLRGAGAFAFLKFYRQFKLKDRVEFVCSMAFSRSLQQSSLFFPSKILSKTCQAYVGFVWVNLIGVSCYGQLRHIAPCFEGTDEWWALDPSGVVHWAHIIEPSDWKVWTFDHVAFGGELVLMRFQESESLLRHFFGEIKRHNLPTKTDLANLGEHLGVLCTSAKVLMKMPTMDLIDSLLDMICDGDVDWCEAIKKAMRKPKQAASAESADRSRTELGTVLDEVVLSELSLDERKDFKEVQGAIAKNITSSSGWTLVDRQEKNKGKSGKSAKTKAKAKSKAKPKAAQPKGRGRGRGRGRIGSSGVRFNTGRARKRRRVNAENAVLDGDDVNVFWQLTNLFCNEFSNYGILSVIMHPSQG